MKTQRNTWKPWQGDEIWQRSFRVPVHPQENDVWLIVCVVKVILIDYRLEWHCPCTGENLSSLHQTAWTSAESQHEFLGHWAWPTASSPQPPWPEASLCQPLPKWYWRNQIYTNIWLFSLLLRKSIVETWCKDCKCKSDLSKWQHLVC